MVKKEDLETWEEEEEVYPEPTEEDLARLDQVYHKRVQMWWSILAYSLGGIALFGGVGYLLDGWLGTRPLLLIVLIVLSLPFTQYALYKRIQKMIKK